MEVVEALSPWFWETIMKAEGDSDKLSSILWQLTERELSLFQYEYETAISSMIGEAISVTKFDEEEAREFLGWIVSQGKAFFMDIYNENPDMLLELQGVDFDARLVDIAAEVYLSKFRDFLPIRPGGYWYFMLDPWVATPEYQKREGDRGISIHNEFLKRLGEKSE